MLKILSADCLGQFPAISTQFSFRTCAEA